MALHRIGNYELLGELGRGGMGVVYRGVDSFIKRPVAIKTIYLSEIQDQEERQFLKQRLFREAQSAGILSHPNIVTIYQIGEQEEITYIAMEYVEGSNLADLLRKPEKPTLELLLGVFEQTAAGLDHAHGKGVVHRDIKPANIIVRPDGVAKITDFGVAKITAQSVTRTGMTLGTPHFMAPEQIQGKQIDGRADQYSLGVVMYEILTGKKPFTADSMTTLIFRIVSDPVDPKQDNPRLSDATAEVLKRALAKSPEDRFPTCAALVQALRSSLSSSGALAGTSSALPIPTPVPTPSVQPAPTASIPLPTSNAGRNPETGSRVTPSQPAPVASGGATVPPRPNDSVRKPQPHGPATPTPFSRPQPTWDTKPNSGTKWLAPAVLLALLGVGGASIAIFYLAGGMSLFSRKPTPVAEEQVEKTNGEIAATPAPEPVKDGTAPETTQGPEEGKSPAESSDTAVTAALQGASQNTSVAANASKTSPPVSAVDTSATKPTANTVNNTLSTRPSESSRPSASSSSANKKPSSENASNTIGDRQVAPNNGRRSSEAANLTSEALTSVPDTQSNNAAPTTEKPRQAVVTSPRPVVRVPAIYPATARRDGVSGTVGLRAVINTRGEPTNIQVTKGIRPDLDEAAKTALSRWRFQPGTSDGQPIEAPVNVEISFNLVQERRGPVSLRNP